MNVRRVTSAAAAAAAASRKSASPHCFYASQKVFLRLLIAIIIAYEAMAIYDEYMVKKEACFTIEKQQELYHERVINVVVTIKKKSVQRKSSVSQ